MLAKTKNYRPSDKEPFMNERSAYSLKLLVWGKIFKGGQGLRHLRKIRSSIY